MSDNFTISWIFSLISMYSLLPNDITGIHVESLAVITEGFRKGSKGTHKAACSTCLSFAGLLFNHAKHQNASSVFEFKDLLLARYDLDCPTESTHPNGAPRARGWLTCDDCASLYCSEACREADEQRCLKDANRGYGTPSPQKKRR